MLPVSPVEIQRAQIGDLCGRPREHEGSRAANAHAVPQPLLQKRDGPAAAGIQRDANGGGHQHAQRLVTAKQCSHNICRDIPLEQRREQDSNKKIQSGRFDIPPKVFEIAQE